MKIIVTKDEFARLVRECERQNTGYSICNNCVMASFCQGDAQVENFCEIESSVNFSNGLVINPCDFRGVD